MCCNTPRHLGNRRGCGTEIAGHELLSGILPMMTEVKRIWKEGDELPKELPGRCRATFLAPSWMKKASGWACKCKGMASYADTHVPVAVAQVEGSMIFS